MNEELFQDFLDERTRTTNKGKRVNTERAVKMLRNKLANWEEIGYDTDSIIKQSIERGWTGLFLVKGQEPKRTPLKARGPLSDVVQTVRKEIPKSEPSRGRQALEALKSVMEGR